MNFFAGLGLLFLLILSTSCSSPSSETAVSPTHILPTPTAPVKPTVSQINAELATAVPQPNTPTPLPSSTPWPTSTSEPTATPSPFYQRIMLGSSVQEQPIELVQIGQGSKPIVIMGALHGGHECNTYALVEGIISHFIADPALLPPDVTLYAIPVVNPDGCITGTRTNANQVDLNRNWDTPNWLADAEGPGGVRAGSGGSFPFSEPETTLVRDWLTLLSNQFPDGQILVISYHSVVPNSGLVQPGYSQPGQPESAAMAVANTYASVTGYLYSNVWVGNYSITGEFIHWATDQGFIAVDVELPDKNEANTIPAGWSKTHIETNLDGLLAIMTERP